MSWDIIDAVITPTFPKVSSVSSTPPFAPEAVDFLSLAGVGDPTGADTVAQIVGANIPVGIQTQDFLYDFYFRIWVFPNRLELRNPRVGVDIPFAIWNAYPYKNTLQTINTLDADGLELDVLAPSLFREIEYRTVNLQILPSAPLSIDAVFDFIFQQGSAAFNFVAERASVLSIIPDVPVNESWQWLTDIIVTTDGTEQRAGLRAVPRRLLELKLIALNEPEILEKYKQFMFDLAGQVVIPYFQYATLVTSFTPSGGTDIFFEPAYTDLREGEYAYIQTKTSQELVKILTITATGATLDAPVTIDVDSQSLIAPAFPSVIENRSGIKRYSVHEVAEININSTVSQARSQFSRPGSTQVIATFDGYNILDKLPLADNLVENIFDAGYERFDYQTGSIEQVRWWEFTRDEGPRQFKVNRIQHADEMDYWRDFLDDARGALNPFLVPTYRRDLLLASTPDDGALNIVVAGSDYATLYFPMEPYKRFYMWTDGGILTRRVTAVAVDANGDSVCTLSAALPTGDPYRAISHISYLLKTRLASDEVKLEHYGLYSIINLAFRTVPE